MKMNMNHRRGLVIKALLQVQELRRADFRGDDSIICELLKSYSDDESVAEVLWDELPSECDVQDIADLLALWSWRDNDNGAQVMRTLEHWIIQLVDERRVAVALNLDAYPFTDPAERVVYLKKAGEKYPALQNKCREIIDWTKSDQGS